MSNPADFVIENGVLTKYVGSGGDVVIPEGVTKIGWSTFAGNDQIQSVVIANTVTVIGGLAFAECATLSSVQIPESVQRIEWRAFDGCAMLNAVFGMEGILSIDEYAFRNCASLKCVTISKRVQTLRGQAFSSCSSLNEVVFESDTVELEYKVFKDCYAIRTVRIPMENEENRSRIWTALLPEMRFALCFSLIKNGVPLRYEEMRFTKASYRKKLRN